MVESSEAVFYNGTSRKEGAMPIHGRKGLIVGLILISVTGAGFSLSGCAAEPKPPTRAQEQEMRRDSDRFFEKMKQEERAQEERAKDKGPGEPMR